MNSVHEQCPNSDLNSAHNSALHQARSQPYVATSISCRDLTSAHNGISRSRHRNQVATSHTVAHVATSNPCRDAKPAQPHFCYVATPFFHVATSLVATHVATSTLMSRPQMSFPGRNMNFMSRPRTLQS